MTARIIIVDKNDLPIGHQERSANDREIISRITGIWILNEKGEILLAQRAKTKRYDPEKWGPAAAGTVEEGETYESNIRKEVEEELGVRIPSVTYGPKIFITDEHDFFCQWFWATVASSTIFELQPEEVLAVRWISRNDLLEESRHYPERFITKFTDYLETLPPENSL